MKSGENIRNILSDVRASSMTMIKEKTDNPITMSLNYCKNTQSLY